jgi:hypothetical protein
MKLVLQNYAVIILIKNTLMEFKNKKINSLQICDLPKVTEFYTKNSLEFVRT